MKDVMTPKEYLEQFYYGVGQTLSKEEVLDIMKDYADYIKEQAIMKIIKKVQNL